MNAFTLLKLELSKLKEKKGLLFALVGVLLVPLVYVAILLSATWGPYDNLDKLPVAFVNKDAGAESDGAQINIGKDLEEELKGSKSLGWNFVTDAEAKKGLESQKYYMVIEVPEDFSKRVTTVLDTSPQVPELNYIQNEGLNFLAAQVTNSAVEKIRGQLNSKITETYVRTLFARFGEISNGFAAGADGSQKIYEGTTTLSDGTGQLLQSLTDKSADVQKLATGASTAANGANQLLGSIQGGSSDIKKLAAGSRQLEQGIVSLKAGSVKVLEGLKSANAGSTALTKGLESQLTPGAQQLAGGIQQVTASTKQLSAGSQGLTAGLKAYLAKNPDLMNDQEFLTLVGTSDAISQGLAQFDQKVQPLQQGANALVNGATQLTAGSKQLQTGIGQLVSGQTAATSGIDQLKSGATQVANGNASVSASWTKLNNAVSSLNSGLSQISSGNKTVANGWNTMTQGVTSLNNGALQLKSGSQELNTGLVGGAKEVSSVQVTDDNISMFASPVSLKGDKVNDYNFYRDSTAPYILSLALFVGTLILSFFIEFKKPATTPKSAISWYASKFMQLSILAIVQGIVLSIFTLLVVSLDVQNVMQFILFTVLVSLTFMTIVFFLVSVAGNIGRFVALAFLIMQLSTTGSNLPIPMLPDNLESLSKFLPLTYSNGGFKSIISLGDQTFLLSNVSVLLIFLAVSAVFALAGFLFSFKSSTKELSEANS